MGLDQVRTLSPWKILGVHWAEGKRRGCEGVLDLRNAFGPTRSLDLRHVCPIPAKIYVFFLRYEKLGIHRNPIIILDWEQRGDRFVEHRMCWVAIGS
jgi:hypothetical protein